MSDSANPWLTRPSGPQAEPDDRASDHRLDEDPVLGAAVATSGPQYPPLSVPPGQPGYPVEWVAGDADVWVFGLHGGAGSSTVERLLTSTSHLSIFETRAWPRLAHGGRANVLLVARTHGAGLEALRVAERQWAAGDLQQMVTLLGTVLVADGPRPHRSVLAEIKKTLANNPKTWHLGWNEDWRRLGQLAPHPPRPRDSLTVSSIVRRLNAVNAAQHEYPNRMIERHPAPEAGPPGSDSSAEAAG